jgi:predicted phosphohydrolase
MKVRMKTALCYLLCFSLLLPTVVSATAKNETPLSVFIASDIHYRPLSMLGPIGEQTGLPGDPLYWYTNKDILLTYESDAILNEMLSKFEASSSNILLIPGDLSDDGYLTEHLALAEKLKKFEEKTGKKIFVINGNHDLRGTRHADCINLEQFKSIYADFGYDEALACDSASASYTADLGDGYRLLAIDCCNYGGDTGDIKPGVLSWIEQQVAAAKHDGKKLIAMTHYSVLEHFNIEGLIGNSMIISDYKDISSKFADWGIKYVFTGHIHGNDISSAVSANGNKIYDIETSSLDSYPDTYRTVTFSDNSVKVESKNIESINIADLPVGYTPDQLALIKNDFPAYSLGYFRAGMNCLVNEASDSTESIAGMLGVQKNTGAYEALNTVVSTLGKALNLPIYDTAGTPAIDSVEEIAACAGVALEPGNFKNITQIIGDILAANYHGDENIPFNSPEMKTLFTSLKAVLVYSLVNIPVNEANLLFEQLGLPESGFKINDKIYTQAAKLIYMRTAAGEIINIILTPVVEGFTRDAFAPGDLNVTLEPYNISGAAEWPLVPITGFQQVLDIFLRLVNLFYNTYKTLV